MEEALISLIRGDATVFSTLGNRIDWLRRPQGDEVYPASILQRASGVRQYHMAAPDGLVSSRVQIDVWGEDYITAKTALRAIIAAISGYRGTILSINFQGIFIENERDSIDAETDANIRLFRVSADAQIWHTE